MPSVDIWETKDRIILKAELPGLDVEDIDVTISGELLTIKGEKKREAEENDGHCYCAERYFGFFQRAFQLATSVEADKVEASFDKGVLKVTLPKNKEAKKVEIEIEVE